MYNYICIQNDNKCQLYKIIEKKLAIMKFKMSITTIKKKHYNTLCVYSNENTTIS